MSKKVFKIFLTIYLLTLLTPLVNAQRQTGSIKGKITDKEGFPLPGAFVYISSPALLGIQAYITSYTGRFVFYGLPPSRYTVQIEMPGFKAVIIENLIVRVGRTATLRVTMEMTTIEEEITAKIPSPTIDVESVKSTISIEENLLKNIPYNRDLHDIINSLPGVIPEDIPFRPAAIVHGSTARSSLYTLDGIFMNDAAEMNLVTTINFDIIEEIELETAAHPPEVGQIDGGYINIITKSGGNDLTGGLSLYISNDNLGSTLRTEEELSGLEAAPPPLDKRLWDFSLSLGGSFMEDRAWLFGNARFTSRTSTTSFIPWTDPLEKEHEAFDWDNRENMAFFKLTVQLSSELKISSTFNYADRNRPIHDDVLPWNLPQEATHHWDHGKNYLFNGSAEYMINQNTFAAVKGGYFEYRVPLHLNEAAMNSPQYFDESTGHRWGSARFNEEQNKRRLQGSASLTRFQETFIGHHELKLGLEYEQNREERSAWKEDNLFTYFLDGSPYYFGEDESPITGETVGKGRIQFYLASKEEGQLIQRNELTRIGLYIQDSLTFADNVTLNLGIRFDRTITRMPGITKGESGNPVSLKLGEEFIEPIAGLNPYASNEFPEWHEPLVWNSWSPRLGLIFDIFGSGKSVIKASFARYREYMTFDYYSPLNPFYFARAHTFFWYDENEDEIVDENDSFVPYPEDYRLYNEEYYQKRVAPDSGSPFTREITVGFQQELFPDFSFGLSYIHKKKGNIFENVLYDPDLEKDWYFINREPSQWWVPFQTIVPGTDDFPDTPVTLYFWTKDAPLHFDRVKNVPELKRNYNAFAFTFKKRMSNNWQLNGSVVYSKATGNIGLNHITSSGFSEAANSPNYFVNRPDNAKLDHQRSLLIKLMGTFKFPYDFYLSLYYRRMSELPWARSVTIIPPLSWTEENNVYRSYVNVLLEEMGSREKDSFENLDIRIEKEFRISGLGTLGIHIDIINALGRKYDNIFVNDDGYWFPSEENSIQGQRVISPNYDKITSLSGVRVLRLNFRLSF